MVPILKKHSLHRVCWFCFQTCHLEANSSMVVEVTYQSLTLLFSGYKLPPCTLPSFTGPLALLSDNRFCPRSNSAAALHLVLLAYAYLCTNRWWPAIPMKASGRGERGGNVCAFGMIKDRFLFIQNCRNCPFLPNFTIKYISKNIFIGCSTSPSTKLTLSKYFLNRILKRHITIHYNTLMLDITYTTSLVSTNVARLCASNLCQHFTARLLSRYVWVVRVSDKINLQHINSDSP